MHVDYLIVGAGCAGLSLALRLARRGLGGRKLLIVDPRTQFQRDRTWCFWDVCDHPFRSIVAHRWFRWSVADDATQAVHSSHRYPYCYLGSDAFHDYALRELRSFPEVEVCLGQALRLLVDDGESVHATLEGGNLRAKLVFDSRPEERHADGTSPFLLQHFGGVVVQTEHDVFDPSTATLMDFRLDQSRGVHFMYTLPLSKRTALVENTFMTSEQFPVDHDRAVDFYLRENYGIIEYRALHREAGVIPMTTAPLPSSGARVIKIGLRGGAVRPSTGYAFIAIQRHTDFLAKHIDQQHLLHAYRFQSDSSRMLDALFLSHLRDAPETGYRVFTELFKHTPPDALVRFLSDQATAGDIARVLKATPTGPMTKQVWRAATGLLRSTHGPQ